MRLSRKCIAESVESASLLLSKETIDEDSSMANRDPRNAEEIRSFGILFPLLPMCFPRRWSEARHCFRHSNSSCTTVSSFWFRNSGNRRDNFHCSRKYITEDHHMEEIQKFIFGDFLIFMLCCLICEKKEIFLFSILHMINSLIGQFLSWSDSNTFVLIK